MVIEKVFCTENFKRHYSSVLGELNASLYQGFQQLPPNSLLLGENSEHHTAFYLSKFPMVLIDKHPDMYSTGSDMLGMHSGNWVRWALVHRDEIHIVLPNPSFASLEKCIIPKALAHKLHFYSFEETRDVIVDNGPVRFDDIGKLHERLKGKAKQISIDFDFSECTQVEKIEEVLRPLVEDVNVYDFWLNYTGYEGTFMKKDLQTFRLLFQTIK